MGAKPIQERIAVVGLGYVGLPLAIALAKACDEVIGFDVNTRRIAALNAGDDTTREISAEDLAQTTMTFTDDPAALAGASMFVVTVPTPITDEKRPDLRPLESASRAIAPALSPGAVVVYESTVFPGVTEEFCGPILEEVSGLERGKEFFLAYSPERINPGDTVHTIDKVVKVVSAEDEATLDRVAAAYEAVVDAGVYRAKSIKVAEAAKVIENTQRDLNIALMNELSLIFDRMDLRTIDVLRAAGTKWNFLHFRPGLVGGHCIGVDPYYLTSKAEALGYNPQVILSGRRINDDMGRFVAQTTIRRLVMMDASVRRARVGVLGLTFKENVPDLRHSKVADVVHELRSFGVSPIIHDPVADADEAKALYDIDLSPLQDFQVLDALVIAVCHDQYVEMALPSLCGMVRTGGVIIDVKSMLEPEQIRADLNYWSL
ncbi:MAG: nucleotide sugar dehydrogenase [Neomegalonema sp.]|nr:nucleotide sugar dehydrogenase [Neomegalonema sp.]